jgi:hypothetical protein
MTFPVLVEAHDGQFAASLVGMPQVRVVKPTRAQAAAALKTEIEQRIQLGELISLEIEGGGVSALAGKYRDDATLRDICAEAYRARDAEAAE